MKQQHQQQQKQQQIPEFRNNLNNKELISTNAMVEKIKECVKFYGYHFTILQLINCSIVIDTFPFCKHLKLLF